MIVNIGLFICIAIMLVYIADEEERKNNKRSKVMRSEEEIRKRLDNVYSEIQEIEGLINNNNKNEYIDYFKFLIAFRIVLEWVLGKDNDKNAPANAEAQTNVFNIQDYINKEI